MCECIEEALQQSTKLFPNNTSSLQIFVEYYVRRQFHHAVTHIAGIEQTSGMNRATIVY